MSPIDLRIADSPNEIDRPRPLAGSLAGGESIRLSHLVSMVRRQRMMLAVPVLIWIVLGIVYVVTTPRSYLAGSILLLDASVSRAVEQAGSLDTQNLTEPALENARLVIRSDTISRLVVDALALDRNPSFLNPPRSGLSQLVGQAVTLVKSPLVWVRSAMAPVATAPAVAVATPDPDTAQTKLRDQVARVLQGTVRIDRVGRSAAFAITYTSHDPAIAAAVVNAYADAYVADVLNANFESTQRTTEWLQERLTELEVESVAASAAAEAFRAANGLVSNRGAMMTEEAVVRLNGDMSIAIGDVAKARALVSTYEDIVAAGVDGLIAGGAIGVGVGETNDALTRLQELLAAAIAAENRITRSFGEDHPQRAVVRSQVRTAADRLFNQLSQELGRARSELATAEARVDALRQSLGVAMAEDSSQGSAQVEYQALQQRAETLATLYQTFLTRFREIEQQKSFPISNVRILSRADVPQQAAGPVTSRILLTCIVLGLIFGLIVAVWREWRERFLRTAEDVVSDTGRPFLGYLPRIEMPAKRPPSTGRATAAVKATATMKFRGHGTTAVTRPVLLKDIHALRHPRSIFSETLRSVRLAAEISVATSGHRVIGVTAARPGEGKSTVALNLAGILAAGGASVLLIDADPRRPGLSRGLEVTAGPGLVEVLLGKLPWAAALREVGSSRVHLLPCISPAMLSHTAELLSSRAMQQVIDEARQTYDYVVVDLSPLIALVDARVMIRLIQHVLLVAEWGTTPRLLLRNIISTDRLLAERLLGTVLNKVDMKSLKLFVESGSSDAHFDEYGDYFAEPTKAASA